MPKEQKPRHIFWWWRQPKRECEAKEKKSGNYERGFWVRNVDAARDLVLPWITGHAKRKPCTESSGSKGGSKGGSKKQSHPPPSRQTAESSWWPCGFYESTTKKKKPSKKPSKRSSSNLRSGAPRSSRKKKKRKKGHAKCDNQLLSGVSDNNKRSGCWMVDESDDDFCRGDMKNFLSLFSSGGPRRCRNMFVGCCEWICE